MKTLGLIGGISWFSTSVYYKTINQLVNEQLGGSHSAKLLLYSVDFDGYRTMQEAGKWGDVEELIGGIALKLEQAGTECILLCSNTPHLIADKLIKRIKIPFLHIADETAKEIKSHDKKKVLLLGTKFTMENTFFTDRLTKHNIEALIPEEKEREFIHTSIINEFTKGIYREETKKKYQEIISSFSKKGAEGVIFGCTEIALLMKPEESSLPVFDTTTIHSKAAVKFALQK